ncbi:iron chelate uptake ABC transporter family permease subunit, partial [Enterobacter asburiae]|uniref:iron chelate uptake ABC transporter family permease subunit n=1 Tax=Enterobacter asburiae TaxID=61645 RepID=UPI003C77F664
MMRSSLAFPIFALLLALGAIMHLGIGARFIAPQTVVEAFFHFDPRNFDHNVIIKLRLLRLCAAMVTGAALGVAGVPHPVSALHLTLPMSLRLHV